MTHFLFTQLYGLNQKTAQIEGDIPSIGRKNAKIRDFT